MTEPVRKRFRVGLSPEEAFGRFTEGIAEWWPLGTNSVGGADAETCAFEGREGGRLFERSRDGSEAVWGTVLAWDPPQRVVFTWHAGRSPDTAQEIEVTFTPEGRDTHVVLTHGNWDVLGEGAEGARRVYAFGWTAVLARYRKRWYADALLSLASRLGRRRR